MNYHLLNFYTCNSLLLSCLFSPINVPVLTTSSCCFHSCSLVIISFDQYSVSTCIVLDPRVKIVNQTHLVPVLMVLRDASTRQWQYSVKPMTGGGQAAKNLDLGIHETIPEGCDVSRLSREHSEKLWKWKRKGQLEEPESVSLWLVCGVGRRALGLRPREYPGRDHAQGWQWASTLSSGRGKPLRSSIMEQSVQIGISERPSWL